MDAVEHLRRLGFGEYEAKAYVALLRQDGLNGYELARAAGVPRPNIYGVLQKLEERGAVLRSDTPTGSRYTALAPEELLRRLEAQFQDTLSEASDSLSEIGHAAAGDYVWNVSGYPQMLGHARALLEQARERVLVAINPPEASSLSAGLQEIETQDTQLTTLCLRGCPQECGHCRGQIHRRPIQTDGPSRWLVIVADDREMLAAEIGQGEMTRAVRSRLPLLVNLASRYVRQTIVQDAVFTDLSGREEDTLSRETRALLDSGEYRRPATGPEGYFGRFLEDDVERPEQGGD